jgi:RHS repeat-associated protein
VVWPLVDNEGSIRDLATYNAGTSTTTVANHIVYSAYGQVLSQTNPSVTTTFGYAGGFTDPDTALVRFGFRWYDPTSTVWISADPSGFYFGGTNPSQYCGGAPTNWADPTGLNDTVYYDPAQLAASWQAAKAAMGSSPDVVAAQVSLQAEINQAAQDEWENSPEGIAWANSPDGIAAAQASLQAQINQVAAAQAARVAAAQSAARLAGLSNTRRALLALTSAAGNQPCERQFWEAVSLAMQLYGSNGMAALADIKDLREKRPDLDNPLLACLDHYFQGFANVAWSGMPWGGLPVWASNLVNSVYSGWKASGIPGLPTDTATPASPITDLQWQAGYWGARDGENYYPQR